jgi:hypothetical protein
MSTIETEDVVLGAKAGGDGLAAWFEEAIRLFVEASRQGDAARRLHEFECRRPVWRTSSRGQIGWRTPSEH